MPIIRNNAADFTNSRIRRLNRFSSDHGHSHGPIIADIIQVQLS
jgi:hypothetical protein